MDRQETPAVDEKLRFGTGRVGAHAHPLLGLWVSPLCSEPRFSHLKTGLM